MMHISRLDVRKWEQLQGCKRAIEEPSVSSKEGVGMV